MKIKVLGSNTTVVVDKIPVSENAIAAFYADLDLIVIDPDSKCRFQDFCHELFHLLVHRSGVKQTSMSHDVEEILSEQFGLMMQENFKDILRAYNKFNKKIARPINKKQNRKKNK